VRTVLPIALGAALAAAIVAAVVLVLFVPLGADEPRAVASPSPTSGTGTSPVLTPAASTPVAPTSPPPATSEPSVGIAVGNLAPDFVLPSPQGADIRLSEFRGRPVWINFWAPWCPACRTEMPRIERMYQANREAGLVVLGVAVQDSPESVVAFASEVGATYPIAIDADGRVAATYGGFALPVHYWIDCDGIVRDWAFGELPPDLLAASLDRILEP
jgi:peroxiredoxin